MTIYHRIISGNFDPDFNFKILFFQIKNGPIDTVNEIYLWSALNGYHKVALWLWDKAEEGCERLMVAEEINFKLYKAALEENHSSLAKSFNKNFE